MNAWDPHYCILLLKDGKLFCGWFLDGLLVFKAFDRWVAIGISFSCCSFGVIERWRWEDCRDPSSWEHVPHISWWHMARIIIRITPIRIHMTCFSYPDCLKEGQTTLINISIRTAFTIHPNDQHRSSGYDCPGHWLKKSKSYTLSQRPTMAHVPPPAEWRDKMKWQQVPSHDHFTWSPTSISNSRITYYDLCQPSLVWWWPCHHLVSSWPHKISPHH